MTTTLIPVEIAIESTTVMSTEVARLAKESLSSYSTLRELRFESIGDFQIKFSGLMPSERGTGLSATRGRNLSRRIERAAQVAGVSPKVTEWSVTGR